MTGYRVVNLGILIEELGEDTVKDILSSFSCPLNPDVEGFLKHKAIDFAKQSWAQTHLVFASFKNQWVLSVILHWSASILQLPQNFSINKARHYGSGYPNLQPMTAN